MPDVCRSAPNLSLDVWRITAPLLSDSELYAGTIGTHGFHSFVSTLTWLIYFYLLHNVTTLTLDCGTWPWPSANIKNTPCVFVVDDSDMPLSRETRKIMYVANCHCLLPSHFPHTVHSYWRLEHIRLNFPNSQEERKTTIQGGKIIAFKRSMVSRVFSNRRKGLPYVTVPRDSLSH
jgi:hypothetical protein